MKMKEGLPPPAYLNSLLVAQIGLHFLVPKQRIIPAPYRYIGFALVLIGVLLNIYATRFMQKRSTSLDFFGTTCRLLVTGPFRFSRNPIFLSGVAVSLGIAVVLGSLIAFLFPAILFQVLDKLYIPVEEYLLGKRFGHEYRDYKQRVPRWI